MRVTTKPRLVGNPFVSDRDWLAACHAGHGLSCPRPAAPAAAVRLLAALFLGVASGIAGYQAIHLGYDWGYWSVANFCDQITGSNQYLGAYCSLNYFILPMFFGFSFACFKEAWYGSRRWTIIALLINLGWVASTFDLSFYPISPNPTMPWFMIAALFFNLTGMWFGGKFHSALRFRVRLNRILACTSVGVGLMGLMGFIVPDRLHSWPHELAAYSAILIGTGALAAVYLRAKDKVAGVILSTLAVVPILMANFLNVAGNIICLILDMLGHGPNLGWQALLSAVLISAVTLASTTLGGILGYWFRRRHS